MKLAFTTKARYSDYSEGYARYKVAKHSKGCVSERTYHSVVRAYCKMLADSLLSDGMVDLPCEMGSIAVANILRKPQYRNNKFIGFGKWDWNTRAYDGQLKAFGIVFLPNRDTTNNLRSFGFVANRQLFRRIRAAWQNKEVAWVPVEFNDEMI